MPPGFTRKKSVPLTFLCLGLAWMVVLADRSLGAETPDGSPRIVDLKIVKKEGEYRASFRLNLDFDPDLLEEIESGLETTLEYRIQVVRPRRLWFDDQVLQRRMQPSVKYDSLSHQYHLTLKVDGNVQESSTTDKREEMKRWLTEIPSVVLGPVSAFVPPEDFVVRVKSDLGPRFVLFFIPWGRDTRWAKVPLSPARVSAHEPGE